MKAKVQGSKTKAWFIARPRDPSVTSGLWTLDFD
jgi:hypothetical protein